MPINKYFKCGSGASTVLARGMLRDVHLGGSRNYHSLRHTTRVLTPLAHKVLNAAQRPLIFGSETPGQFVTSKLTVACLVTKWQTRIRSRRNCSGRLGMRSQTST